MLSQQNKTEYELFHSYNALVSNRTIYFGSEDADQEDEYGVDYLSSAKIIKNLLFLDSINHENITIYWNAPGGCWFRGMAIYDTIMNLKSHVTMIGLGMIRSMGTIIMQACDARILTEYCGFMIHDGTEAADGDTRSFEAWGKYATYSRKQMYQIYLDGIRAKHPLFTLKKIEDMCSHDNILQPIEALELGLVDRVLQEKG